ncbi:MAG: zf-HC2 domain-containing protein [Bryobacteraceae bacterium]|jgi:anti-sigma factor RsiW|nr:zf-HC2 domain-containing protein [Bryobacteraceae bacterium]
MSQEHRHSPKDPACLEVFARLSEYLDGELPPEECAAVEAHIADCPPCVEFLENLKRCIGASREMQTDCRPEPMPKAMEDKLRAAWMQALARKGA